MFYVFFFTFFCLYFDFCFVLPLLAACFATVTPVVREKRRFHVWFYFVWDGGEGGGGAGSVVEWRSPFVGVPFLVFYPALWIVLPEPPPRALRRVHAKNTPQGYGG